LVLTINNFYPNKQIDCSVNDKVINVKFLVINKNVNPLLGIQEYVKFRFISRNNINLVEKNRELRNETKKDEFVKKHKAIFEALGVFPGKYTGLKYMRML